MSKMPLPICQLGVIAVALLSIGCSQTTAKSNTAKKESKQKQELQWPKVKVVKGVQTVPCAPLRVGEGSLVQGDGGLIVASGGIIGIRFDYPKPNPYLGPSTVISPDYGSLVQGLYGKFGQTMDIAHESPVRVYDSGAMVGFWIGNDYTNIVFTENSERWVAASYSSVAIGGTGMMDGVEVRHVGDNVQGVVHLIPGAAGRLAVFLKGASRMYDKAEVTQQKWFDPVTGSPVKLPGMNIGIDAKQVWVDQGRVWSQTGEKVTEHGILSAVKPIKASDDALLLSPWSVSRSPDKLTLNVKSIYKGGPTYKISRSTVWSQSVATYGKHALYDDGELYDLRTGELVAIFQMAGDNSGEFLIRTAQGAVTGTKKIIEELGLKDKLDTDAVKKLLNEVLVLNQEDLEDEF